MGVDADKQVGREKWQNEFDALPVLPVSDCLVGGKKRLDLPQTEVLEGRLFVLGRGVNGEPIANRGRAHDSREKLCLNVERMSRHLQIHLEPLVSLARWETIVSPVKSAKDETLHETDVNDSSESAWLRQCDLAKRIC